MYEFAQKWKITPKNLRNDDEEFDDNDELEDNFFDENGSVNEKKFNLKNSRITLYQRKRPAVVKTPYFSFTENSDEFSFQAASFLTNRPIICYADSPLLEYTAKYSSRKNYPIYIGFNYNTEHYVCFLQKDNLLSTINDEKTIKIPH